MRKVGRFDGVPFVFVTRVHEGVVSSAPVGYSVAELIGVQRCSGNGPRFIPRSDRLR